MSEEENAPGTPANVEVLTSLKDFPPADWNRLAHGPRHFLTRKPFDRKEIGGSPDSFSEIPARASAPLESDPERDDSMSEAKSHMSYICKEITCKVNP